jgi:hypothetical protein
MAQLESPLGAEDGLITAESGGPHSRRNLHSQGPGLGSPGGAPHGHEYYQLRLDTTQRILPSTL